MTPTYILKLGLITQKTDINAQKIKGSLLVTYEMILVDFSVQNKLRKI